MLPSSLSMQSLSNVSFYLKVSAASFQFLAIICILISFFYDRELRIRQQPRELSSEQRARFQAILRDGPKEIIDIESPAGDLEASRLVVQLVDIFGSEGWQTGLSTELAYFVPPIEGIIIKVRNLDSAQPYVSVIQHAFEAINMPVKLEVGDRAGEPPIQLLVGHKPSR
jgi:hypothetical protein